MALRVLIGIGVIAGVVWWSLDDPDAPPAAAPVQARAGLPVVAARPAPLPALDTVQAPPERLPTDAPVVATNLRPTHYVAPVAHLDTTSAAPIAEAPVLGSLRMAPDPDSLGVTGQGFVPTGGVVPQVGGPVDPGTFDFEDPEEVRLKKEAGDFDNPVDLEEQIKRNAHGDGALGTGDTATGWVETPSNSEMHVDGAVVDPADAPNPSANERHVNGERPAFDWRAAGLSPTEANMVEVEDVTSRFVAEVIEPSETMTEDPPVPTWQGEGTIPD